MSIAKEKRRLEQPRSSKDRIRNGKNSAKEKENRKNEEH